MGNLNLRNIKDTDVRKGLELLARRTSSTISGGVGIAGSPGATGATGATGETGPAGTTVHHELSDLDYANAGHTGFSEDGHTHTIANHDHTGDAGDGGAIYPRVVASVTLNNLSADTSTTADLLATAPAGWYRYTVYVRVSTAGAAGDVLQCSVKWRDVGNRTSLLDSIQSFGGFYFGAVADPSYIDLSSSVVHSSSSYMFYHESATYDIHYCVLFPVKTGSPVVQFKGVLERVT
jgi:hypothetical protein